MTNDGVGLAGRTPTFSEVTTTNDGFTLLVTNFDSSFTYSVTVNNGATVTISNTGFIQVTGITTAGNSAVVTVTTSKVGYLSASASVEGNSTPYVAPSFFITITAPSISQSLEVIVCITGEYVFVRQSVQKETPKITERSFTLMSGTEELAKSTAIEPSATFVKAKEWRSMPLHCEEEIKQESVANRASSMDRIKFQAEVRKERLRVLEVKRTYNAETVAIKRFRSAERLKLATIKNRESKANPTVSGIAKARNTYLSSLRKLDEQIDVLKSAAEIRLKAEIELARINKERELEVSGQVVYFY